MNRSDDEFEVEDLKAGIKRHFLQLKAFQAPSAIARGLGVKEALVININYRMQDNMMAMAENYKMSLKHSATPKHPEYPVIEWVRSHIREAGQRLKQDDSDKMIRAYHLTPEKFNRVIRVTTGFMLNFFDGQNKENSWNSASVAPFTKVPRWSQSFTDATASLLQVLAESNGEDTELNQKFASLWLGKLSKKISSGELGTNAQEWHRAWISGAWRDEVSNDTINKRLPDESTYLFQIDNNAGPNNSPPLTTFNTEDRHDHPSEDSKDDRVSGTTVPSTQLEASGEDNIAYTDQVVFWTSSFLMFSLHECQNKWWVNSDYKFRRGETFALLRAIWRKLDIKEKIEFEEIQDEDIARYLYQNCIVAQGYVFDQCESERWRAQIRQKVKNLDRTQASVRAEEHGVRRTLLDDDKAKDVANDVTGGFEVAFTEPPADVRRMLDMEFADAEHDDLTEQ